jgi:hypothetical protein
MVLLTALIALLWLQCLKFDVFGNGSAIDIELLGNLANRQALMMKTARLNNGFHVNHSQDSSAKNGEFSNNQGGALLSAHTLISWCSFTCALTHSAMISEVVF